MLFCLKIYNIILCVCFSTCKTIWCFVKINFQKCIFFGCFFYKLFNAICIKSIDYFFFRISVIFKYNGIFNFYKYNPDIVCLFQEMNLIFFLFNIELNWNRQMIAESERIKFLFFLNEKAKSLPIYIRFFFVSFLFAVYCSLLKAILIYHVHHIYFKKIHFDFESLKCPNFKAFFFCLSCKFLKIVYVKLCN